MGSLRSVWQFGLCTTFAAQAGEASLPARQKGTPPEFLLPFEELKGNLNMGLTRVGRMSVQLWPQRGAPSA